MSDRLPNKVTSNGSGTHDVHETPININGFTMRIDRSKKRIVYQYELVLLGIFVSPSRGRKEIDLVRSVKSDAQRQSRRVMLWELFHHVFDNHKDVFSGNKYEYVYDCGNILFSRHKIVEEGTKEISIDTSRLEGEARQQLQRLSEVIIKITHTGSMDLSSPDLWSSDSSSAAEQRCRGMQQFLDILTSQEINKRSDQLIYKNKRYNKQDEPGSEAHLSKVIKKGSEKNTAIIGDFGKEQEALLVIEPRCSPFFQAGKLQKYFEDVQREFRVSPSDRRFSSELNKHLSGLQVVTTHREKPQHLIIKGTTELSVREQTFSLTKDDKTVNLTVARYYEETYNISVSKDYPCIVVDQMFNGKKEKVFYPCEVLEVTPGQRVQTQKQSPKLVDELIRKAQMLPSQLKEEVGLERSRYELGEGNAYLRAFGVLLENDLREVSAKVLPPPLIQYASGVADANAQTGQRQWKIGTHRFFLPAKMPSHWIVAVYENSLSCDTTTQFVNAFMSAAERRGLNLGSPRTYDRMQRIDAATIYERVKYWRANDVKFVLFIVGGECTMERSVMKEMETVFHVVTQMVRTKTAMKAIGDRGAQMVLDNLIMKTNLKLGGINHGIAPARDFHPGYIEKFIFPRGRMFIGLDMQSPGSPFMGGSNEFSTSPTVVGITSTLGNPADMRGTYWYQPASEKKMIRLPDFLADAVGLYEQKEGFLPTEIVIYRGGVSDGEIPFVVRDELPLIKKAIESIDGYNPRLLVILAQKKSGMRLMPKYITPSGRAQDENVMPGTSVSNGVVSANLTEFILVAQQALKGTAKPTKYTVLCDEGGERFTCEQLEHMTHQLCYLHGIVTLPVSRPVPLYSAADLVKRGTANWKAREYRHNSSPTVSSGIGQMDPDYFDPLVEDRLRWMPVFLDQKYWA